MQTGESIILYTSEDGRSSVTLYARDGSVWLNQLQMAELFATSKPNISMHINNILKEKELNKDSVIKMVCTCPSIIAMSFPTIKKKINDNIFLYD